MADAENSLLKISISYFRNFKPNFLLKLNLFHKYEVYGTYEKWPVLFLHFKIHPALKRKTLLFYSKITFVLPDCSLMLLTMYFLQSSDGCLFSFSALVALTPCGNSKVPSLIKLDGTTASSTSSFSQNETRLQLILQCFHLSRTCYCWITI